MKTFYLFSILFLISLVGYSQQEFHVFPENGTLTPGTETGTGSLQRPWDLQTALSQTPQKVNGGDTIWLHKGVYNGRFVSRLKSTIEGKNIVVSSFKNEWAVLNGNVSSSEKSVLTVYGQNVTYKDFEITWVGEFPRKESENLFQKCDGINHNTGVHCKFINLIIHNNPGSGFNSWKQTGNTSVEFCLIFNNGFMSSKRGSGIGMYIQNQSNDNRLVKNNIIFNNYYKGVEVWSASKKSNNAYVKNIILDNNVIFNSGLVSGMYRDNLIIATDDDNGINIAKNIQVKNNIFYHNTDLSHAIENTNASSLTLGFNEKAPVENITIDANIIIGRKDALRILSAKALVFKNNIVYSGYARFDKRVLKQISNNWLFENNTYYTRNSKPIRIQSVKDFSIKEWNTNYGLGLRSQWKNYKEFNLNKVLNITKNNYKNETYRVTLFSKNEEDVVVDFSKYHLPLNVSYSIKDVENYHEILTSGVLNSTSQIVFPMKLDRKDTKTRNNFGVYIIEFKNPKSTSETPLNKGFFERLFKWLF